MSYVSYRVRQGDTLESIASDRLGSADRWREIALLNRLRFPFLSDTSFDQYGQPLTSGLLTTAIAANALTYAFQGSELPVYATTYAANCVFYVESAANYDPMVLSVAVNESTGLLTFKPSVSLSIQDAITSSALGQVVAVTNVTGVKVGMLLQVDFGGSQETVTIAAISGPTADTPSITAVFAQSHAAGTLASYGVQRGYGIGSPWTLFGPQRDQRLKVLRIGDLLQLPSALAGSSVVQTGDALFVDLLGSDVRIGADGFLQFGVAGDFQRVSGTANLVQALRLRLNTPSHTVDRYPSYGNPLSDFLGQTTEPYFVGLAEGLVRQTLLQDPRVNAVRSVTVKISGATITVDAMVEMLQSSELLRLENLVVAVGQ